MYRDPDDQAIVSKLKGIVKHPQRYPKHETDKGQLHGGECNVTRCTKKNAVFFNRGTRGYYCVQCARGINGFDPDPLCVIVDEQLTLTEMNALAK